MFEDCHRKLIGMQDFGSVCHTHTDWYMGSCFFKYCHFRFCVLVDCLICRKIKVPIFSLWLKRKNSNIYSLKCTTIKITTMYWSKIHLIAFTSQLYQFQLLICLGFIQNKMHEADINQLLFKRTEVRVQFIVFPVLRFVVDFYIP